MKALKYLLLVLAIGVVIFPSPKIADAANGEVQCANSNVRIPWDDDSSTTIPDKSTAESQCSKFVGFDCPPGVSGQTTTGCAPTTAAGLLGIINKVFTTMFVFLVTIASFTLLYAAFVYITSEGEQEKIVQAKRIIIYAFVALIVAALAFGAPRAIQSFIAP